jgi:putative thioredoxin
MAGAIDLSGLKQRAQQPAPGSGGESESPAGPASGTEVTEASFETDVLAKSNEVPVVVVLWTPRSDSSVQLVEIFSGLAAQDGGTWSLATVNVDTTPRVAQAFGVQAVPTVVALAAGQPLASFQGMQAPEQLRQWVDSLLSATAGKLSGGAQDGEPETVDPALAAAREHLDAGDFVAARRCWTPIRPTSRPRGPFGRSTS